MSVALELFSPVAQPAPMPAAWGQVTRAARVSDLRAVEELLDQLDAQGHTHHELVVLPEGGFLVRWE